jgi:hypothetical protein
MSNFILAINSLICLILSPVFFLFGIIKLFEEPVSGLVSAFVVAPLMAGLAIVFDHVREQLEKTREDDRPLKRISSPNAGGSGAKEEFRISDLAGTPWEKKRGHQDKS